MIISREEGERISAALYAVAKTIDTSGRAARQRAGKRPPAYAGVTSESGESDSRQRRPTAEDERDALVGAARSFAAVGLIDHRSVTIDAHGHRVSLGRFRAEVDAAQLTETGGGLKIETHLGSVTITHPEAVLIIRTASGLDVT